MHKYCKKFVQVKKKFYIYTIIKNTHKMENFKFTDPTEFASHVMPFTLNGEIAEIELNDRPDLHVEVRRLNNGFIVVLNAKAVKKAVRWSTIAKFLNQLNNCK